MYFLFRQNNFFSVFLLMVIMLLISVVNAMIFQIIPLKITTLNISFTSFDIPGIWIYLFYMAIILIQSFYLNQIATQFKLSRVASLTIALGYILLHFAGAPNFIIQQVVLSNFFLIYSLHALFNSYDKKVSLVHIFNIGLGVGIASLIYQGNLGMILWALVGLLLVRTFDLRETLLVFFGFASPFFLLSTYLYVCNDVSIYHSGIIRFDEMFGNWSGLLGDTWYFLIGLLAFIFVLALINSHLILFKTTSREKKFFSILYIQPIFSVLGILFIKPVPFYHFINLIPCCAILLGVLCVSFKRSLFSELILLLVCSLYITQLLII